jgi:hypothetical protein
MLVVKKFAPLSLQHDPPVFKDIGSVANLKGVVNILFY